MGKEVEERRSARNCGAEGVKDCKTMKVVKEVKGCTGYVGGGGVCGIVEGMLRVGKVEEMVEEYVASWRTCMRQVK